MTRYFIFLIATLFLFYNSNAQFLTQSAEGKSTIPLPMKGFGVGIDFGKSEIALGVNNYDRVLNSDSNQFKTNYLVGLNLSVKSSEGLGSLFSAGDIVPAGNFLGIAGYSFHNNIRLNRSFRKSDIYKILKNEDTILAKQIKVFKSDIIEAIDSLKYEIEDPRQADSLASLMIDSVKNAPDVLPINNILKNSDRRLVKSFWPFFKKLDPLVKEARKKAFDRASINKQIDSAFIVFAKRNCVLRFTPFITGGFTARNFTLFNGVNISNLGASFTDTLYKGGNIGVGFNLQAGSFWLGVTYNYVNGDNFINLSGKEYTLKTTDTSANQTLIREKKQTAYSGKYSKVETNELNIDLVKEFRMNDSSRIITNFYTRSSLYSRDTSFLKNYTNIGVGFYFLGKKSKFLGGLYVELPDINNNIEKAKSDIERNIRPPLRKLTFGIVTKISLSSILGFANRGRLTSD